MKKFKVRELFTVPVLIVVWILLIHSGFEFFLAKNINNLKRFEKNDASIFVKEAENDLNYHIKNLVYFSSRIDAYIQNRYYNPDSSEIKLLIWDLIKNNSDAINLVSLKFGSFQYVFNIEMEPVNPAGITLPYVSSGTDKNHKINSYSFLVQKNNIFFHSPINEKISGHKSSLDIQLNFNLFLETLINNAVTDGYSYALTTGSNKFLFGNSDLVQRNDAQVHQFSDAISDIKLYYYRVNPLLSGFFMSYIPWIIRLLSVFVLSLVLLYFRNRNRAERSLLLYKLLSDNAKDVVWVYNLDQQKFTYISPSVYAHRGFSQEEAMSQKLTDSLTGESLSYINNALQEKIQAYKISNVHEEYLIEVQQLKKDGTSFWAEISYSLKYNDKKELEIIGNTRKIDTRKESELAMKKLNRELFVTSFMERSLLESKTEMEVLNDVCSMISNNLGYKLAWIGYAEDNYEKSVKPVAFEGIGKEYIAKANLSWDSGRQNGQGPTGRAIRNRKTEICQDILEDPTMVLWIENAKKFGYSSSIATPLVYDSEVFGALMIYSEVKNAFNPDEISFLEKLANDLSGGISYMRIKSENRATRERLHQVQELSGLCSWEFNFETNIYTLYENCFEIFGISYENRDVINFKTHFEDKLFTEDIPILEKSLKEIISQKKPQNIELRLKKSDDEIIWLKNKFFPIFENERVVGINAISIDITETKKISEELQKLLIAVDQSPASIVLTDIKGNIEYVNPQFSETTGYSKEEVMGNNPRILKSSLHDKNFYEELWSTISSGKQWKGIFFNKKKDGTVYYESAIISPIINEKGVITNYLAIKDNITEKFQAERALKISEARFRAIVDNSMTGIAIIDEEGRHIYTNPSTKKIHGYKQEEIIGSLFADIIFKDDKDQAERILKDIASGLKHFAIEELRLIHKVTKKVVWVNLNISKYPKVEEFEQERILLLFQDITKHKEAEIQLKQSIITRDKMFSIISHDLRGPIGNLIPLFDMFSNMETSEELRNELIKEMRRTTATTYDLLENLLSWSKFQTKSISLVPVNFNVNETIEEIVELYNNEANQKNISVTIESANKNFVFADKNSVNLIIRNMLYNAIKFTPKFGKISLKAQSKEGVIFVSITDSGIGMTEDVAKNIFNKDTFYTSYGTNNEIGTGLGLQLCREFVIKNGGKINVISRVGKGTTFEFTLPKGKQTATKTSLVIPKIKTDSSSLKNKRILLVEDDKFNLVYTKSLFEKWRVSYDVAGNGEEAITKLSENTYDVVVMDLEMPVMDGITTCIHIRTQLKLEVPVIAISANIGSDIVEKTQRAGFTDYVSKPIDSGFLFVKIANALKIKVEGDEVISGLSSSQYSQDSAYSSIEQLKIAFGDDTSMAKEMIFKFLEVTPSYYKDMMYFYEISDFQNLRQIAHKLKSSIGFFTTEDLAHEVKLINDYAGTADTYNLEPVMTHFKEWFPKLCDELKLLKL